MIGTYRDMLEALYRSGPVLQGNEEELTTEWVRERAPPGSEAPFVMRPVAKPLDVRPPQERFPEAWPWVRPMDIPGAGGVGRAMHLKRLVERGWVERQERGKGSVRQSFRYRLTVAGRDAMFNARALDKLAGKGAPND